MIYPIYANIQNSYHILKNIVSRRNFLRKAVEE